MIDPAWLSLGATVVLTPAWIALVRADIRSGGPAAIASSVDLEPICGCGHHYALHHRQEGEERCGHVAIVDVLIERGEPSTVRTYNGRLALYDTIVVYANEKYGTVERACACVRYTGPEPLPRYVA